jgi:hypothetical protein
MYLAMTSILLSRGALHSRRAVLVGGITGATPMALPAVHANAGSPIAPPAPPSSSRRRFLIGSAGIAAATSLPAVAMAATAQHANATNSSNHSKGHAMSTFATKDGMCGSVSGYEGSECNSIESEFLPGRAPTNLRAGDRLAAATSS